VKQKNIGKKHSKNRRLVSKNRQIEDLQAEVARAQVKGKE